MKGSSYIDYCDLIAILGRVSVLIDVYDEKWTNVNVDNINSYYSTILFHISNGTDRYIILRELTKMIQYVDDQLKITDN